MITSLCDHNFHHIYILPKQWTATIHSLVHFFCYFIINGGNFNNCCRNCGPGVNHLLPPFNEKTFCDFMKAIVAITK